MASSTPPSLVLIYLRATLGALTKTRSLGAEVTKFPSLPEQSLNFSIDPKHVQEFIKVVGRGSPNPQTASTSASSMVPITYLQCYLNAMPMALLTHAQFPLNIIGSVHEATRIESRKSLLAASAGDLRASCRLVPDIVRSDKNDLIMKVVTSIDSIDDGERIMDITNTYRVLNPQRHKVKVAPENKEPVDYFDNTRVWESLSTWNFPVDTGRRYAALNGDINPIHIFPITAKLFGYKSCIAHGMYNICKLVNEPRFADLTTSTEGTCTVTACFTRPTMLPNSAVMAFLKKGTGEYVIGTKNKDGQLKETVKGTISFN